MGHVPSLCVLCSPCYSRWCYGQILAIAPLQLMYGKEWEKNTWHSLWERGRVNLIHTPYLLSLLCHINQDLITNLMCLVWVSGKVWVGLKDE